MYLFTFLLAVTMFYLWDKGHLPWRPGTRQHWVYEPMETYHFENNHVVHNIIENPDDSEDSDAESLNKDTQEQHLDGSHISFGIDDLHPDGSHIHIEERQRLDVVDRLDFRSQPINALDHIDLSDSDLHVLGEVGKDTPQLGELRPQDRIAKAGANIQPEQHGSDDFRFADIEDTEVDLGALEGHSEEQEPDSQTELLPVAVEDALGVQSPVEDVPQADSPLNPDSRRFSLEVQNEMLSQFQVVGTS